MRQALHLVVFRVLRYLTVCLLLGLCTLHAIDQDLGALSIEELMDVSVTSVAKHEQKLGDAAAAITVLSNNDLQRSGITSIPDALRLVPGMDVGAVNAREFAVSARGFNSVYASKLLVLVDGRAVYTPLFSGVFWDLQQPILEDVDRIEVIRGPGATIWGANAVNGVINIVTRDARDTQGTYIYGGGGDVRKAMGGVRQGGRLGENTFYRIYASAQSTDDYPLADGSPAGDHWHNIDGGFRIDRHPDDATKFTWQGDLTSVTSSDVKSYDANTLGRWTHRSSERASTEVQAYFDRVHRDDTSRSNVQMNIFDLSVQHTFGLGTDHNVIWGAGYRWTGSRNEQSNPYNLVLSRAVTFQLYNAFIQDEWQVVPGRFTLTAGVKLEHHTITGFEIQPSVRGVYKPAAMQTIWAAVSRAVRTPSELEGRNLFAIPLAAPSIGPGGGLYVPTLLGNPDVDSEVLWAYETGYRIQPSKQVSFDLTAYYNDYSKLITFGPVVGFVPGTPVGQAQLQWDNIEAGKTSGAEVLVTISPSDTLRFTAGYTYARQDVHAPLSAAANLPAPPPLHQASLRIAFDPHPRLKCSVQFRYVDGFQDVPAYFTADLHLAWHPTNAHGLEFSIVGQNLFSPRHLEESPIPLTTTTEVPRMVCLKAVWRF